MALIRPHKRRKIRQTDDEAAEAPAINTADLDGEEFDEDFLTAAQGWGLEQNYEQRPRKAKGQEKETTRLPIKTAEGRIEKSRLNGLEVESEEEDIFEESADEGVEDSTHYGNGVNTSNVPVGQQILEAKEQLARLAGEMTQDPEEHVGNFRGLTQIANTPNPVIKKLAIATQMTVFKDVIPGYRIRPLSELDQKEKVSKDVKRLRAFEQSLVKYYHEYLKDLEKCAKHASNENDTGPIGISSMVISCVCELLLSVPHFNFRNELLKIMVNKLGNRKIDNDFRKCIDVLQRSFADDPEGSATLEAVSTLSRMMKAKNYRIEEDVLNIFLSLPLLGGFSAKASYDKVDKVDKVDEADDTKQKMRKSKRPFLTKKQRKAYMQQKAVEKDFKEADAIFSHEQRDRNQAEMLKIVFATYFRILKLRLPHLVGAVLEGLAKYTHLINQDFFGDLLEVLKDLIKSGGLNLDPTPNGDIDAESDGSEEETEVSASATRDPTRDSLLCITTAFALLEGQDIAKSAQALHLDLTFFITHLYRSLHALCVNPDIELSAKSLRLPDPDANPSSSSSSTPSSVPDGPSAKVNVQTSTVLLLRALSAVLTAPRNIQPLRLAAFTKQLHTSALHFPEKSTAAVLALIHSILKSRGRKIAALWNTTERKGDGAFDAFRSDAEGSNPFASTIWEGELLRLHYSEKVRAHVKEVDLTIRHLLQ